VRDGFKAGVLYVSALIARGDQVLAIYGEGDSHTSVATFDASDLADELRRNPFRPVEAVRIRYEGRAPSPFVRAMWAIRSFCESRSALRVRLYVTEPRLRAMASVFKIPNLAVRQQAPGLRYDYRLDESGVASTARILNVADETPAFPGWTRGRDAGAAPLI
jgi:hypothetical protein